MGLFSAIKRLIQGSEPMLIDYEGYQQTGQQIAGQSTGTHGAAYAHPVVGRITPGASSAGTYKIQQSYDSLLSTVRELRETLDGQAKRQDELLSRLSTLPAAVEALPQTSQMQTDVLRMINDRLNAHAEQQRKINDSITSLGTNKAQANDALQAIRDQIETGNEIDRQLVDSFNRFSMMLDRLHSANQHAVECLGQVRDSYAATAMQMQEWIEKSRHRNNWLVGAAFAMSLASLVGLVMLFWMLAGSAK